jgi:hypothetical protein
VRRAALRRLAAVVGAAVVFAAIVGLLLVALLGLDVRRGLAVGYYLCGAGICGLAVVLGTRPPVRGTGQAGFIGLARWAGGGVRWATPEEHREAPNFPALLLTIGVVLVLIGVAVDDRS